MPVQFSRPLVLACAAVFLLVVAGTGHHKRDAIAAAVHDRRHSWAVAKRSRFSRVVCFGDSLSDAGNGAWLFTNKTWPSDPMYIGHRFTDGPVFSEYVAQELGVPLISYATGGASISHRVSSRSGPGSSQPVDCVMDRIAQYSVGKTDERDTLFILYAGANDAYFSLQEGGTPPEVLADLKECVEMLRRIGAEYIIIPTLPPLGDNYPYSNAKPEAAEPMHRFSTSLRELYIDWTRTQPDLALADFYALFDTVMQRPAEFGFKEEYLKIGCLQARCGKRSREYIWFDDYHPTTYVHALLADVCFEALDNVLKRRWW